MFKRTPRSLALAVFAAPFALALAACSSGGSGDGAPTSGEALEKVAPPAGSSWAEQVTKSEDGGYVTPIECVGDGATYVSRVREDPTVESGLSLWCVSDNLRKGAALNAVQIAELLGRRHLKKG